MPRATVNPNETVRVELESAPPDGFVVLRKMTYGQQLKTRELTYQVDAQAGRGNNKTDIQAQIGAVKPMQFAFKTVIVDHNLEDEDGRKLDFNRPEDVMALSTAVANEIEQSIEKMNAGEDLGNSQSKSTKPSPATEDTNLQPTS